MCFLGVFGVSLGVCWSPASVLDIREGQLSQTSGEREGQILKSLYTQPLPQFPVRIQSKLLIVILGSSSSLSATSAELWRVESRRSLRQC